MISEKQRPLKRAEKAVIRGYMSLESTGERIMVTFIFFCLVLCPSAFGIDFLVNRFPHWKPYGNWLFALMIGISLTAAVKMYRRHKYFGPNALELGQEIKHGKALVRTFTANDAILLEEFESNGMAAYIDVEDGNVLFLMGPYLDPYIEQRKFPCRKFEIAYTPGTEYALGLTCTGDYFEPGIKRPPFTKKEITELVPDDGSVFRADFSALMAVAKDIEESQS